MHYKPVADIGLGVFQNFHHFHRRTQRTLGGRGSRTADRFSKMFVVHCDFEKGDQNQHLKVRVGLGPPISAGREGSQKRLGYSV